MKTAALRALSACALFAQNPTVGEMKTAYTAIKNNLTRMAEKMPADQYEFKPVNEIRSFGALMAHVADSQLRTCSTINGEAKTPTAGTRRPRTTSWPPSKSPSSSATRPGIHQRLECRQMMSGGRGQTSRLGLLTRFIVVHGNEEYGYGSIYLRLKGIVPPSSDTPAGGRKQ